MGGKPKLTLDEFIERSNIKHNNKYDYSKSIYLSGKKKISICCPHHGLFNIRADAHRIDGQGCPLCRRAKAARTKIEKSSKSIIIRFKETHGEKYQYDNFIYKGNKIPSAITCKTHGDFNQTPDAHLAGKGCGLCANGSQSYRKSKYIETCNEKYNGKSNLYVLKITDTNNAVFYKIGITVQDIKSRFSPSKMPYKYSVIKIVSNNADKIFDLELKIKKELSNFRYRPLIKFGGSRYECFSEIPDYVYDLIDNLV